MDKDLAVFEGHKIRRVYEEKTETRWFSVLDIIQVLTQQPDFQTARKYWNKLKERLRKEGSQSVTDCHRLKMPTADGKKYLTDVANAETLLRLVQSVRLPASKFLIQSRPSGPIPQLQVAGTTKEMDELGSVRERGKFSLPPMDETMAR
jgi:hypothetical protein